MVSSYLSIIAQNNDPQLRNKTNLSIKIMQQQVQSDQQMSPERPLTLKSVLQTYLSQLKHILHAGNKRDKVVFEVFKCKCLNAAGAIIGL